MVEAEELDTIALARTQDSQVGLTDPLLRTAAAPDSSPGAADAPVAASASVSGPLRTSRIGRHALLRQLGAGGMGVVYAAYDEELDRKVAIKLLHAETSGGTEGRARLLREAQSLARLSHPNVVQIHEIGEHRDQVYVAMEYVEGTTLDVWQKADGRALAALLGAYRQAGEGLHAAHQAGLVHRDFKPDNVLVGVDGRVRVADFGLARRGGGGAAAGPLPLGDLALRSTTGVGTTTRGALVGTPAYMSPEQLRGDATDARSDIFSFCLALWEALHGERPFAGDTLHQLARSVASGQRRRPVRELPTRLQHAIERGLAVDPDARWSTMEPLLAALAIDPEADPSSAARERRLFTAIAGAMALGFLTLLTGAVASGEADIGRLIAIFGIVAVLGLLALFFMFRRTLMRNRYHQRLLAAFFVLAAVSASQRFFGLSHGAPLVVVIIDTLHIVAAVTLTIAVYFVRWTAVIAGYCAVAIVLGYLAPWLFPGAMLVFLPMTLLTVGYFWRRDALADL